jgi:hypothetical protein
MLNLHRLTYCTLLLPRTDSSLNWTNSVTYIAKELTRTTGNACHVTTSHCCMTSPRSWKTASSIVVCWIVCTELLPGNALIKSVTLCYAMLMQLISPKIRQKNMVVSPLGPRTKNVFAGEDQQQFTQSADWLTSESDPCLRTEKYGHGSHGAWNQEWLLVWAGNKLPDQVSQLTVGSQE